MQLKHLKHYWKFGIWISLVTLASLLSGDSLANAPKIDIEGFDKFVHFCMYAGLSFLLIEGNYIQIRRISGTRFLLLAIGFAILYGSLMELLQYQMGKGRSAEFNDFIANTFGAVLGAPLFAVVHKKLPWLKYSKS